MNASFTLSSRRLNDFQIVGSAKIGVGELTRDLVLDLHLFDEANVFLGVPMYVLEREYCLVSGSCTR